MSELTDKFLEILCELKLTQAKWIDDKEKKQDKMIEDMNIHIKSLNEQLETAMIKIGVLEEKLKLTNDKLGKNTVAIQKIVRNTTHDLKDNMLFCNETAHQVYLSIDEFDKPNDPNPICKKCMMAINNEKTKKAALKIAERLMRVKQ
jgi:GH35 family endo-1,4-beta-xylanase